MQKKPFKKKGTADNMDKYVGEKLRSIRMFRNMSQEKVGECVGVTFQQIQKYERGTNRISASRLYSFSNFFQIPIAEFFPNEEDGRVKKITNFSDRDIKIMTICKGIKANPTHFRKLKQAVKIITE